jgi:hypothetical protein
LRSEREDWIRQRRCRCWIWVVEEGEIETTVAKAAAGTESVEHGSMDAGKSELVAGRRRVGAPPRSRITGTA